jgi:hypothetical protein
MSNSDELNKPPPLLQSDLTAQEKRAQAYRLNQFADLQKLDGELMAHACSQVKVTVREGEVLIPAAPNDLMVLIQGMQHKIRALEINVGVLTDMVLQSHLARLVPRKGSEAQLVETTRDPELEEGAQLFLKAAGFTVIDSLLNLEQFWIMTGKSAEATLAQLRRALLSQGKGSILRS